jgi:hypothetical protein
MTILGYVVTSLTLTAPNTGAVRVRAGDPVYDAGTEALIQAAGGMVVSSTSSTIAASSLCANLRKQGANDDVLNAVMLTAIAMNPILANGSSGAATMGEVATADGSGGVFFGPVTATEIGSGAATNGQVATANGSGGVTWESPFSIQTGTVTLASGTFTLSAGITVTANSVVLVSRKTQGTVTSTVQYEAPGADRIVGGPGTGSITFQASIAAGTVNAADDSVLDYAILG